jgi:hypothetical protein
MTFSSNRLRLFGLIQELQKEASELGLSRTAAALEVTTAVAMQELSDCTNPGMTAPPIEQHNKTEDEPS